MERAERGRKAGVDLMEQLHTAIDANRIRVAYKVWSEAAEPGDYGTLWARGKIMVEDEESYHAAKEKALKRAKQEAERVKAELLSDGDIRPLKWYEGKFGDGDELYPEKEEVFLL